MSPISRPDLALHHLEYVTTNFNLERHLYPVVYRIAAKLLPNDPEIAFNLAAVLEASEV
jgi:hypothetical protein